MDQAGLPHHSRVPYRVGGGGGAPGSLHRLAGIVGSPATPCPHCPLDVAPVALCFHNRCRGVLDAVPFVFAVLSPGVSDAMGIILRARNASGILLVVSRPENPTRQDKRTPEIRNFLACARAPKMTRST